MNSVKSLVMLLLACSVTLGTAACGSDEPDNPGTVQPATPSDPADEPDTPKPTFDGKMIVGYYPTWSTWWGEPDFEKLSVMCIAFAEMRGDGNLYYSDALKLKSMIKKARDKGVKVLISLRDAQNVSAALADNKLRQNLAKQVKKCITELDIDGVDVDYEEWGGNDYTKSRNLEQFYKDIRAQIGDGMLLTAAVGGKTSADPSINASMLSHLDYVFPMVYDACGGWEGGGWGSVGQHSSYQYMVDVVNFFTTTLKVPKEKLCPGVPFYGYEFKSDNSTANAVAVAYRDILDRFPGQNAHLVDNIGLLWYNGMTTIGQKAQYIVDKDLAGIMIWELSQDSRSAQTSLLNAIYSTFHK